jgi:two-component system, NarL family, sensor histidine kinase DegS
VELTEDRRVRVKQVLERRGLSQQITVGDAADSWLRDRFMARARALFYARMVFLTLGLLILAVPVWRLYFGFTTLAFGVYFFMLLYSVANYLALGHPRAGGVITYVTLLMDLVMMVIVVAKPITGGGLANPLLASQLLFTTLFALLFPRPLAILPPLLALPIVTRIDQLLDRSPTAIEILTLLWYLALNFIIIYVLVYLNERETSAHREVVQLQGDLKDLAVIEERNRLAREIHDGLGASLSSLIIQTEYLGSIAKDETLLKEIREIKASAEESIEELRRSLRMMREDFDLGVGIEEYVKTFADRTQLPVRFATSGSYLGKLSPESSLALFRVLQELLTNALKHARAKQVDVRLSFLPERVQLTVKDDGQGFDLKAKRVGHYGLINMQERANKVGGSVEVDARPGAGVNVVFSVPLTP